MFMIRLFSVLCKLNHIKCSDKKWLEDAAGASPAPEQPCPDCSAKECLCSFGHYERYLVEWDGQMQKSSTVTVPRYICDFCGHTHAVLPSCIIPYSGQDAAAGFRRMGLHSKYRGHPYKNLGRHPFRERHQKKACPCIAFQYMSV